MTSEFGTDRPGHQLAMRLRGAYAHLRRRSNLAFSRFGMTSDQYVLLSVLAECREATQQQLVRRCFSDTATIGTMLTLLESKRLVLRRPHPRDGRARSVRLTRAGRDLAQRMRRGSSALRAELVSVLNRQELSVLLELLERLTRAMNPPGRKGAAMSK